VGGGYTEQGTTENSKTLRHSSPHGEETGDIKGKRSPLGRTDEKRKRTEPKVPGGESRKGHYSSLRGILFYREFLKRTTPIKKRTASSGLSGRQGGNLVTGECAARNGHWGDEKTNQRGLPGHKAGDWTLETGEKLKKHAEGEREK